MGDVHTIKAKVPDAFAVLADFDGKMKKVSNEFEGALKMQADRLKVEDTFDELQELFKGLPEA
eukprot:6520104-Pyramimonas_sp.AAC.1